MHRTLLASTALLVAAVLPAQDSRPDRSARRPELHKRSGDAVRAVDLALNWLTRQQHDDGYWTVMHDLPVESGGGANNAKQVDAITHRIGLTGLSLLTLLADGNSQHHGPYSANVLRGIHWLLAQQDEKDGMIGTKSGHSFIYGHAIATLALAETAAFDSRDERLRDATRDALNYLEKHRNPYPVWRYMPRDGDNDTSVTGWCTMALVAGEAAGLEMVPQTKQAISSWFIEMTDPVDGRTGYTERGGRSSRGVGGHAVGFPREMGETCTAMSVLCRALLGESLTGPIPQKSIALIAERPPVWDPDVGAVDEYYWFCASHAMHQVGGEAWQKWSDALYAQVVPAQHQKGERSGSWDPVGVWGHVGGRVYSTALNTLSLQSAYRLARVADRAPKVEPEGLGNPRHGK